MFELVLLSTFVIYGHLVVFYEKFIRQQITEETYATFLPFRFVCCQCVVSSSISESPS